MQLQRSEEDDMLIAVHFGSSRCDQTGTATATTDDQDTWNDYSHLYLVNIDDDDNNKDDDKYDDELENNSKRSSFTNPTTNTCNINNSIVSVFTPNGSNFQPSLTRKQSKKKGFHFQSRRIRSIDENNQLESTTIGNFNTMDSQSNINLNMHMLRDQSGSVNIGDLMPLQPKIMSATTTVTSEDGLYVEELRRLFMEMEDNLQKLSKFMRKFKDETILDIDRSVDILNVSLLKQCNCLIGNVIKKLSNSNDINIGSSNLKNVASVVDTRIKSLDLPSMFTSPSLILASFTQSSRSNLHIFS